MIIIDTYFKFRYFFVISINVPTIILIDAVMRTPSWIPNIGISKNPAVNVPKKAPILFDASSFPTSFPIFVISLEYAFNINGKVVPIKVAGIVIIPIDIRIWLIINRGWFGYVKWYKSRYTLGIKSKTGKSKIPKNPTAICINAKYFNGFCNPSVNLPATQLPIARPKMNEATIIDTAYAVVPKTRDRGRIQIIS